MKEENRKYEEWLRELKATQPVLTNPEQLTADILQRVSASNRKNSRKRLYSFGSWLSGIAATLLLCFLLTESLSVATRPNDEDSGFIRATTTTSSLPPNWESMSLTEKGSYLIAYQKKQERQKELIYNSIQKKLLNEIAYENK